jgi:hypothetical protein
VVEEKPRAATAVAHLAHLALVARPPVRDLHARRNRGRPRSRVRGTSAASLKSGHPDFRAGHSRNSRSEVSNAFQIGRFDALLPRISAGSPIRTTISISRSGLGSRRARSTVSRVRCSHYNMMTSARFGDRASDRGSHEVAIHGSVAGHFRTRISSGNVIPAIRVARIFPCSLPGRSRARARFAPAALRAIYLAIIILTNSS